MGRIKLGPRLEGSARPTFLATIGSQSACVGLDSSAVMLLGGAVRADDLDVLIDVRRGVIREAAERLYDQGFYTTTDDGIEIILSGLDIEPGL